MRTPADFGREVTAIGRCLICSLYGRTHGLGDGLLCGERLRPGPKLESHHVVPQRALKGPNSPLYGSERLQEALCDPRNGIPVGQLHHDAIEDGRVDLTPILILGRAPIQIFNTQREVPQFTLDLPAFAFDHDIEDWVQQRLGL